MKSVRVRAYAKVNLFLRLLAARPDGYHEIESILHGIDLADDVEVMVTGGSDITLEARLGAGLSGPLPPLQDDLARRAASAYLDAARVRAGLDIRLVKRIPVGAGLGGGSADAAAVVRALHRLLGAPLSGERLGDVAASLGSDVPFFLVGGTALATGRGEVVAPLSAPTRLWLVLGISDQPLLTGDVYARARPAPGPSCSALKMALEAGDIAAVAAQLHNDLAPAALALRPGLAGAEGALVDAGALGALMSGSGPTIFGLARDERHAREVAAAASGLFDRVAVAASSP